MRHLNRFHITPVLEKVPNRRVGTRLSSFWSVFLTVTSNTTSGNCSKHTSHTRNSQPNASLTYCLSTVRSHTASQLTHKAHGAEPEANSRQVREYIRITGIKARQTQATQALRESLQSRWIPAGQCAQQAEFTCSSNHLTLGLFSLLKWRFF